MMSWAVLVITYALAQYEEVGRVSDSLMVRQTEAMASPTRSCYCYGCCDAAAAPAATGVPNLLRRNLHARRR